MTSTGVYSKQVRDTASYSYPDPAVSGGYRTGNGNALVKVVNTLDQSATATLYGSTFDDAGMEQDTEDDPSTTDVTIGADDTAVFGTTHPWSFVRLEASADSAPTSGGFKVVFQSEDSE